MRWQQGIPLAKLMTGGDSLAEIVKDHPKHAALRICVDSDYRDKRYVTVPFVMHRMPPAGMRKYGEEFDIPTPPWIDDLLLVK